jgi:two-component system, NarL family, response regulator NreC
MPHIRVLIADDHTILRAGLKLLINAQADMDVVSEAADGDEAVQAVRETTPHVALLATRSTRAATQERCRSH